MIDSGYINEDVFLECMLSVPLMQCDGHVCIWRRHGEQHMPHVIQQVDRFVQGSVMVWAGISIEGHMNLAIVRGDLTAAEYIEQILLHHVVPAAYCGGPEFLLMHDNARAHVVTITIDVLQRLEIHGIGMASGESRPKSY